MAKSLTLDQWIDNEALSRTSVKKYHFKELDPFVVRNTQIIYAGGYGDSVKYNGGTFNLKSAGQDGAVGIAFGGLTVDIEDTATVFTANAPLFVWFYNYDGHEDTYELTVYSIGEEIK